jgi:hypothetical protein
MKSKDPKRYWRLLNGKKSSRVQAGMNELHDHFKHIYSVDDIDMTDDVHEMNQNIVQHCSVDNGRDLHFNRNFTTEEVQNAISMLKCGKAAGIDGIVNEYIKYSGDILIDVYVKLFNTVLNTGEIPKSWIEGIIVPIYKNKGDPRDANNYRGITLVGCMAKLFTSLLNSRLEQYLNENHLMNENQAGFRKNYGSCFPTKIYN